MLSFSLADRLLGVYEDMSDNSTNETSVFAEKGGITLQFGLFILFWLFHFLEDLGTDCWGRKNTKQVKTNIAF